MKRNVLNAALITAALLAGGVGGCVGYNVYPPEQGTGGFSNPNSPPVYQLMREALKWTVRKYPPGGQTPPTAAEVPIPASEADALAAARGSGGEAPRIAISLFTDMDREVYRQAVRDIGQGAVPLTPETETLPRYSVSRVWVCGDEAKVDVFRPVAGLGTDNGAALYQPITVNLRGGVKFWRVTSYRVWSIGTFPAPDPEYLAGSYTPPEPPPAPATSTQPPPAPPPAMEPVPADATPATPPASEPQGDVPPSGGGAPSDPV